MFEKFHVNLARLLPHPDTEKQPGDRGVAGIAGGDDPVSVHRGEEVMEQPVDRFDGYALVLARGRECDTDFEGVGHIGQAVNSHIALKFPGAAIMNGKLQPPSTMWNFGRRLGCDQLRRFRFAVGRIPPLPASNVRIPPVRNEFGRILFAERGDRQSGRDQWIGHRVKFTSCRKGPSTANQTRVLHAAGRTITGPLFPPERVHALDHFSTDSTVRKLQPAAGG